MKAQVQNFTIINVLSKNLMQPNTGSKQMKIPYEMYASGDYLKNHPSWDIEDSPWKATKIVEILEEKNIMPTSICEIGCGAGYVMAELRKSYPQSDLFGYDIAEDASKFWSNHQPLNIEFKIGDFFVLNQRKYDVILLLDVIEHLPDPLNFLSNLHGQAKYYVFHIPLDLSALTVFVEKSILEGRRINGHIHYYTKNIALSLLNESGYKILECKYSGAAFNAPRRTWKTKLASVPRYLAYALNKDWGVRALGGETLWVLAKSKE